MFTKKREYVNVTFFCISEKSIGSKDAFEFVCRGENIQPGSHQF